MAIFGFGRAEPVRLTPFADAQDRRWHDMICDGVIAEPIGDFAQLRAIHARLQASHPEMRVLAALDDPGQALYTSCHASLKHGLDSTAGHDLSTLGPECFEDGEHLGYLTTPAEIPIRLANLKARAAATGFADAGGVLFWQGGDDEVPDTPDAVMRDPDGALMTRHWDAVHFQFVPVSAPADAFAAMPNGYFTCDLDPMQTYAVARHLAERHGMALSGVGASYLGFDRAAPLTGSEAVDLARDLVTIYQDAPGDAVHRLANALTGKDWLLLRYTDA